MNLLLRILIVGLAMFALSWIVFLLLGPRIMLYVVFYVPGLGWPVTVANLVGAVIGAVFTRAVFSRK